MGGCVDDRDIDRWRECLGGDVNRMVCGKWCVGWLGDGWNGIVIG